RVRPSGKLLGLRIHSANTLAGAMSACKGFTGKVPMALRNALITCSARVLLAASTITWWRWVSNNTLVRRERVNACGKNSKIICSFRSEEHTSELQSRFDLVCRLLLEKKKEKE